MLKTIVIVGLLMMACVAQTQQKAGICPTNNGLFQNDQLTVSSTGNISFIEGVDSLCYNYTLDQVFQNRPGIAISVRDLQSSYSPDQFFSIKPVRSDSYGVIPFVIRTLRKYTSWTKITFSFFAEDQPNIEAGYYQVDSGSLAGCIASKDISVLLPFRTYFSNGNIQAVTFLNGFEITSNKVFGSNSPFEVQIINQQVNVTGIAITVSVTTVTQVQSLFISYIAFSSSYTGASIGSYLYDSYIPSSNLFYTPQTSISINLAQFYGFNGFILSNGGSGFGLTVAWNGAQFGFTTQSNYQYISFNYFFIVGGPCSACKDFPIILNGKCIAYCPSGSNYDGKTCITCLDSQRWHETNCVNRCTNGRVWDVTSQTCVCPSGQSWNEYACIICPGGKTWNINTKSCTCPVTSTWTGTICVTCTGGRIYVSSLGQCACPSGQTYNAGICSVTCPPGQFYNQTVSRCQCPTSQNWDGKICVFCYGGQIWSSTTNTCVCPAGSIWEAYACKNPCSGGRYLDAISGQCNCPSGYWNGNSCTICSNTQIWNTNTLSCVCPSGNWNGLACISCPSNQVWFPASLSCGCPTNQNWNGVNCLTCQSGQNWNTASRSCGCPSGSNWNGIQCINCYGGRQWNSQTISCVCISGSWNGFACVACSSGQTWNHKTLSCSCPTGSNWNGFQCKTCTGTRNWNFQVNDCVCAFGNWNVSNCIQCPTNTNWNGASCVQCTGTRIWDSLNLACKCPISTQWDGATCIPQTCSNGKVSINGLCVCPVGQFPQNEGCITTPTCDTGYLWDGNQCSPISCTSGTSYDRSCKCCKIPEYNCPSSTFWNGFQCVLVPSICPDGMNWNNFTCTSSNTTGCTGNTYSYNGQCIAISSKCPQGLTWVNNTCIPTANTCPSGSYFSYGKCIPYQNCTNGKVWSTILSQCICPSNSFFNSLSCIQCNQGQMYANGGCYCPEGTFQIGNRCQAQNITTCISIPNSNWNGTACLCFTGFTGRGASCYCDGIVIGSYCQRCAAKTNSVYTNGICQCNSGYVELNGACVLSTQATVTCNVATFFDKQLQKCLPCTDGCLSCTSCYSCSQCRPDYTYNAISSLCNEICGDGKRYTVQCDDGNNINGDGCSMDCKIEVGYSCYGGSPKSKDSCSSLLPKAISIVPKGQSRLFGKVILNVALNYLPTALISSVNDCRDSCNSVLSINITSKYQSSTGITARYIPTTSFVFSIQINFGQQPIGQFTAVIGINQNLRTQYFNGVDVSSTLSVYVNPAYLSRIDSTNTDILK